MNTLVRRDLPASPYVAIFTIEVHPPRRAEFLAAMERAMAESAQEPGVVFFALMTERANVNRFTAVDVYADEAAYRAHLEAPQTRWLMEALEGVLIGPPVGIFQHLICSKEDFADVGHRS